MRRWSYHAPRCPTPTVSAPVPTPSSTPTTSLIHARGLTKRFGDFTAVDGIDFDVAPGESFGFLGPNGAGKTSTMRMIGCVSPVHRAARSGCSAWTRPRTGRGSGPASASCPQQDTLDNELTRPREPPHLRPLLRTLPGARRARRADELLEFVQLTERADDQVEPLSGGMKRRLTIARVAHQRARRCCCSTSRPPASTRRPATCSGTASTGSSSAA